MKIIKHCWRKFKKLNKLRDIPCSWIWICNVKMAILLKLTYRFKAISVKIPARFFFFFFNRNWQVGDFLIVQWLGLCPLTVEGLGLIPGAKIWHGSSRKKERKKEIDKLILNFIWKCKGPRIDKIILKKKKNGEPILSHFKTCHTAVWHWHKDRHVMEYGI